MKVRKDYRVGHLVHDFYFKRRIDIREYRDEYELDDKTIRIDINRAKDILEDFYGYTVVRDGFKIYEAKKL